MKSIIKKGHITYIAPQKHITGKLGRYQGK